MFETDGDRLEYVTDLGEPATLQIGADYWATTAIFDSEYVDIEGVESRTPILFCRTIDIYQPDMPVELEYRATGAIYDELEYRIIEVQPDGTGMVILVLERL